MHNENQIVRALAWLCVIMAVLFIALPGLGFIIFAVFAFILFVMSMPTEDDNDKLLPP